MTTSTTADLRRTDRLRRDWYLLRLEWALQDYPHKALSRLKRDLRTELTLAAQDVGMRRAVADLGHPRALAERYVDELGRRLPRWTAGALAAGLVLGVLAYLFLAYSMGTLDTLAELGGGSVTRYPFGAETTWSSTEVGGISVATRPSVAGTVFVLGVTVVAFVLGARVWRLHG